MVTWAKIALMVLQIAEYIIGYLQKKGYVEEGYNKAVAEANARMLKDNQHAKEIMQRVNNLDSDATDKLLRELEP